VPNYLTRGERVTVNIGSMPRGTTRYPDYGRLSRQDFRINSPIATGTHRVGILLFTEGG